MHVSAAPRTRLLRADSSALSSVLVVGLGLVGWACPAGQTSPGAQTPQRITVPLLVHLPAPKPVPKLVPAPKPKPAPVQLTLVGCSHGTVGVSASNVPQPHWVIAALHLRSPRALRRLRLVSIELLDQNGKVVTRSQRTEAFLIGKPTVSYPDQCLPYARQRPSPLSKAGGRPFDGHIVPRKRHRLWLHVRMVPGTWRAARARPTRCRVTFRSAGGETHTATIDQIGGWPTG